MPASVRACARYRSYSRNPLLWLRSWIARHRPCRRASNDADRPSRARSAHVAETDQVSAVATLFNRSYFVSTNAQPLSIGIDGTVRAREPPRLCGELGLPT